MKRLSAYHGAKRILSHSLNRKTARQGVPLKTLIKKVKTANPQNTRAQNRKLAKRVRTLSEDTSGKVFSKKIMKKTLGAVAKTGIIKKHLLRKGVKHAALQLRKEQIANKQQTASPEPKKHAPVRPRPQEPIDTPETEDHTTSHPAARAPLTVQTVKTPTSGVSVENATVLPTDTVAPVVVTATSKEDFYRTHPNSDQARYAREKAATLAAAEKKQESTNTEDSKEKQESVKSKPAARPQLLREEEKAEVPKQPEAKSVVAPKVVATPEEPTETMIEQEAAKQNETEKEIVAETPEAKTVAKKIPTPTTRPPIPRKEDTVEAKKEKEPAVVPKTVAVPEVSTMKAPVPVESKGEESTTQDEIKASLEPEENPTPEKTTPDKPEANSNRPKRDFGKERLHDRLREEARAEEALGVRNLTEETMENAAVSAHENLNKRPPREDLPEEEAIDMMI